MSRLTNNTSRRNFLKTACLLPAFTNSSNLFAPHQKANIPYVDGLCTNIFQVPNDIHTSALSGIIADVSAGEMITLSDGRSSFQRTFRACSRSIVKARQDLREMEDVFLAKNGGQIKNAFKDGKTAGHVFWLITHAALRMK